MLEREFPPDKILEFDRLGLGELLRLNMHDTLRPHHSLGLVHRLGYGNVVVCHVFDLFQLNCKLNFGASEIRFGLNRKIKGVNIRHLTALRQNLA